MAKRDLVQRLGDPENLRIAYAVLTGRGRAVLASTTASFLGAIREHFGRHLDADEARTVTAVMNRMIGALGGEPETGDVEETPLTLRRIVGEA